uniref:Uncharacterized protein n=1 Tax=Tolypothrix bouteillei VB521301 TaxID=1479485 RepID=A0A0C1N5Z7_9CYAN
MLFAIGIFLRHLLKEAPAQNLCAIYGFYVKVAPCGVNFFNRGDGEWRDKADKADKADRGERIEIFLVYPIPNPQFPLFK